MGKGVRRARQLPPSLGSSSSAPALPARRPSDASKAAAAIKSYESSVGLAYARVPAELCDAVMVDFHEWSLVVGDSTLKDVGRANATRVAAAAAATLAELLGASNDDDDNGSLASFSIADDSAATGTYDGASLETTVPPTPPPRAGAKPGGSRASQGSHGRAATAAAKERRARTKVAALESAHAHHGLRSLDVRGAENVTDVGLHAVGERCPTLQVLNLGGCYRVTDTGLRAVALKAGSLHTLTLSGCLGLGGAALAVVGSCCPQLKHLAMRSCGHLPNWALEALFTGCTKLERVDLAHFASLTDTSVKVLAEKCNGLCHLDLEGCRQVSDAALVELARYCTSLQDLNLSRSELPFKVTDVGVLAIAERCPLLTRLELSGCDMITDVGLSWIGRHSAALTSLGLKGCGKITNAGVRALSEGCHLLKRLDLCQARTVTDVGLRLIGSGCPDLEYLDCSGMYLVTDGMKRDFGLEGLQALSQGVPALKTLKLDGCFQVAKVSLRALAGGMRNLTELSLNGCPNITVEGIDAVARSCVQLESVSLARCGDAVVDDMLVSLGRHCHYVRTLLVCDAPQLQDRGISAVVHGCRRLRRLDLTGCTGLKDVAVLPFAEAMFKPGLQHLFLCGCRGVSDTGLQWIADGLASKGLITLSLKGSGITSVALKSVLDAFKYSEYRKNDAYFGVWPTRRWQQRIVINEYSLVFNSAVRLQAAYRAKLARAEVVVVRRGFYRKIAAQWLQRHARGILARQRVAVLRWEAGRREWAADVVRGFNLIIIARKRLVALREARWLRDAARAATQMQAAWRGVRGRRMVLEMIDDLANARRKMIAAAKELQRIWRGKAARKKYVDLQHKAAERLKRQKKASAKIQRAYRGYLARRDIKALKAEMATQAAAEVAAAKVLQSKYRAWKCRNIVKDAIRKKLRRIECCVQIQSQWRARQARIEVAVRRSVRQQEYEEAGAQQIQAAYRGFRARRQARKLKELAANLHAQEIVAASIIQRTYRGHRAREWSAVKKAQQLETMRKMVELEAWGAVEIQSAVRGMFGRGVARARRDARKTQWKPMWDEESGRPFYYNQVTGEIRWRRPQALLDMMRRPVCSNCAYAEAGIECGACAEFFCASCYEMVHGGGKRKGHAFRSLYDYYEKRIDYADGEWPSKWPTEMEQDETVGWLLRIEPRRAPKQVEGPWQLYLEGGSGAGGALEADDPNAKKFYFNSATQEGTYEAPVEFLEADKRKRARERPASPAASNHARLIGDTASDMGDWQRIVEADGTQFFHNALTDVSQYERPTGFESPRGDELAVFAAAGGSLASEWSSHLDEETGAPYYYNAATGTSQYAAPEGWEG